YTAALKENGTFTTIPGAYTPNQFGSDAGLTLPARPVNGQMNGYGDFTTFYATATPDARRVPGAVSGNANSSSLWPELFFPAGTTTLTGANEATWGYNYDARVRTTTIVCSGRRHRNRQCTRQTTV